jgi:hypothetical protein
MKNITNNSSLRISAYCPETCIVFVSCGRPKISERSYNSLISAISPWRDRIKVIISDASGNENKIKWVRSTDADDLILTPKFTSAATSRNLAVSLILDKYATKYICTLEDDFEYHEKWYPSLVQHTERLYGVISPFNLPYGIFSTCDHHIPMERKKIDKSNDVTAYLFGAVAYQRFMPLSHYLSVMRFWDSDILGISYAQTGGQTFRNTMRGFCGCILPEKLSWPIDVSGSESTWSGGKRNPGPPAHSFKIEEYEVIMETAKKRGFYIRNEE